MELSELVTLPSSQQSITLGDDHVGGSVTVALDQMKKVGSFKLVGMEDE